MLPVHDVAVLVLPDVVAFDLAVPAQVFGHSDERERYRLTVCATVPGTVASTTGFGVCVPVGLAALQAAHTIVVPGYAPRAEPPAAVLAALRAAAARGATR